MNQRGRCIYCDSPMWAGDPQPFMKRFDITRSDAEMFKCTAEHKIAKIDNGRDTRDNIAAACHDCNHRRHALDPKRAMSHLTYAIHVAWHVREGTWR